MRKPQPGDTVYTVIEHLYYPEPRPSIVKMEYCVCRGTVREVREFTNSRKPEAVVIYDGPEPHRITMQYPRVSDFGKKVFFDRADAVALAEKMTDEHDRRWAFVGEVLRRPWREEK